MRMSFAMEREIRDSEQSMRTLILGYWGNSYDAYDAYEAEKEIGVAHALLTYCTPPLLFLGTIGNVLAVLTLHGALWRSFPTCGRLLAAASIADFVALWLRCGADALRHVMNIDVRHLTNISSNSLCKLYPFFGGVATQLSFWLVAGAAIEATLLTLRPARMHKMQRRERARAIVALMLVIIVCLNAHCFWTYALVTVDTATTETKLCTTVRRGKRGEETKRLAWPIIDVLFTDMCPYCVVLTTAVIMLTRHRRSWDGGGWEPGHRNAMRQCRRCVLAVGVAYLVLILPRFTLNLLRVLLGSPDSQVVSHSNVDNASFAVATTVCSLLWYAFCCCKCALYVPVSSLFRTNLVDLVLCRQFPETVRYWYLEGEQQTNESSAENTSLKSLTNTKAETSVKKFTTTRV